MKFAFETPAVPLSADAAVYGTERHFPVLLPGCTIPFTAVLHCKEQTVTYIALTRTDCKPDEASFAALSDILRGMYGQPRTVTSHSIAMHPCEQWLLENGILNHFFTDTEHLHFNLYQSVPMKEGAS